MPELPEVETVMRGLAPLMLGRTIETVTLRAPRLRTPLVRTMAKALSGARVTGLSRRAKYILVDLSTRDRLLIHLGMTGGFYVRGGKPETHDHVLFKLDNGSVIAFHDPRRFGQIELIRAAQDHPALEKLGPEPLDATFTPAVLAALLANKKTSIKAALLDQHVVAGIGNIYASEALYRAGVHPERVAGSVSKTEAARLHTGIVSVLREAIGAGGSTLKDYRAPNGELGFFQDRFSVYGRAGERCPGCTCRRRITRIVQNGRSTFFCPQKQR